MADTILVILAIAGAAIYLLWLARRRLTGRSQASCHRTPRAVRVTLTLGGQPMTSCKKHTE